MALSGDDRLPESIQEFRISGRANHILDAKIDNLERARMQKGKIYRDYTKDTKIIQNVQGDLDYYSWRK